MAWDVQFRNGVWLPQIGWWLDARAGQARSFVSHAHSDHLARHREMICSAGTARLLQRLMPSRRRIEHVLPFRRAEPLTADCSIELFPAGHILGSALCRLVHERLGSLLYTGDFRLEAGLAAEPCVPPPAEVLIMETTFGLPRYVFPPAAKVQADLIAFCRQALADGATPVLFAYSLGKSQELLQVLAPAGLPLMLHPPAFQLTRIYEELGQCFSPYREFDPATAAGHVIIGPPMFRRADLNQSVPNPRTAAVTGWALDPGAIYRYQCDAVFPLSDHADFPALLKLVELVQPKRVFTLHGFAQEFARTLRARGLEAWALGRDNQLDLALEQD